MKKIFVFIALMITANLYAKVRVGVLAFVPKGVTPVEAEVVEELFRGEIVQTDSFDLLDRANMRAILEEQTFQQTGCTESECAIEVGKLLNMEYMFYGSFMKIGETYILSVGMVNVENGKIIQSAKEKFDDIEDVDRAAEKIASRLSYASPTESKQTASSYIALSDREKASRVFGALWVPLVATGGILNIVSGVVDKQATDAYETYINSENDFDSLWESAESLRTAANVLYITTYSFYVAAIPLFSLWLGFKPKKGRVGRSLSFSVMPSPRGASFLLVSKF